MATKATTKVKAAAQKYTCQSQDAVMRDIKVIGDLQRQHLRVVTEMNDAIALINQENAPELKRLSDEIKRLQAGVQVYCEANRDALCANGSKTANMGTGNVSWRSRPPSVVVTGNDAVLAWMESMGFSRFIRTKVEVNKEALLNEADVANSIPGIKIKSGVEDFVIDPFEIEVEAT